MRNSAELRRFPSSHPSLFSGFFWIFLGQMRGGNEGEALYRRPDPVARGGGATGPPCRPQEGRPAPLAPVGCCRLLVAPGMGDRGLSPVGGATGPPFFLLQGLRCKFKKNLHLSPVAPIGRLGYIFEIFQNRHIFLKF